MTPETAPESRALAADGGRTIAANALADGAGWIALAALRFVAKVILIRALAPVDFGRVVTTLYVLGLVATGVLIGAAGDVAAWFSLGPDGPKVVTVASLAVVPMLLGETFGAAFRAVNRTWVTVLTLDGCGALVVVAGYLLIASLGVASYLAAVSVHLAAALLSAACVIAAFRYWGHDPSAERHASLRSLLRYGVPLFFSAVMILVAIAVGPYEGMLRALDDTGALLVSRTVAAAGYLFRRHGIHPVDARYLRTAAVGIISWLVCMTTAAGEFNGRAMLTVVAAANATIVAAVGFAAGIWHPSEIAGLLRRPPAAAR